MPVSSIQKGFAMIKMVDINKSFGKQVLFDGVSLAVNKGEKLGLVGRNGHGKSTLFQMILGNVEPDSGQIMIPKNYRIGHLEQHLHFTQPTVLEECALGLQEDDMYETWRVEKVLFGLGFSAEDMYRAPS